ncbi:hypothetical protein DVH24_037375 [Malus domestica]|uniref:COP9 signalosome complex subunit 3 n=1 Tax=Malus domestica TaxID=3750 RepID=A0A498HKB8_MALDO|nr:hypothetical protein DVH24_037375 [Malus domestica]
MEPVQALVANIQGLSSSGDILHLHALLKQAQELLYAESTRLLPVLDQLDPAKHSLGYLYILEACSTGSISKEQASALVLPIARFINSCAAEQIRLQPDKFISVCKRFKDQVMLLEAPLRGVAPMLTAIRKIQASSEHLTSLHPEFLLLCLLSKSYKAGYSILDDDIFEVVTSPMTVVNAIAVEAYKKHILVSLIHNWNFSTSLPKYTSSVAQRNLKNFCQPYIELANCYVSGKIVDLEALVDKYREKYENDNNLGLVKQVISSMYKRNIQRLTQTYLTLSLQDIANSVQLNSAKEAEMHVLRMIEDGEIFATINQKDGMVRFLEDPEQYKTCHMIERIDSSIQRIMALSRKLTAIDETITSDPLFLSKTGRERHRFDFDDFDGVPQKFNI